MALTNQFKLQDNAASTVVINEIGSNGTLLGGDNTSAKSQVDGPGTAYPRSFLLNGTDDSIDMNTTLSFLSGTAFSVSVWVMPSNLVSSVRPVIGRSASTDSRIRLNVNGSVGVRFNALADLTFNLTNPFVIDIWQHLLVTRTTGNLVRVFRNAVESTSGSQSGATTFTVTHLGRDSTLFFVGKMSDMRIYNTDESNNVGAIMAEANSGGGETPSYFWQRRRKAQQVRIYG